MSVECGDLLYSQKKLAKRDRHDLQSILEDVSFTCGAQLQDLNLPERLRDEMCCEEPIEKSYYSAKYKPICVYCAEDVDKVEKDCYPQCAYCTDRPKISRR